MTGLRIREGKRVNLRVRVAISTPQRRFKDMPVVYAGSPPGSRILASWLGGVKENVRREHKD
jgi:hypothetical protein